MDAWDCICLWQFSCDSFPTAKAVRLCYSVMNSVLKATEENRKPRFLRENCPHCNQRQKYGMQSVGKLSNHVEISSAEQEEFTPGILNQVLTPNNSPVGLSSIIFTITCTRASVLRKMILSFQQTILAAESGNETSSRKVVCFTRPWKGWKELQQHFWVWLCSYQSGGLCRPSIIWLSLWMVEVYIYYTMLHLVFWPRPVSYH